MSVRVLFFASLRESVGTGELDVELGGPITFERLLRELKTRLTAPGYAALTAESVRIAVNQTLIGGGPLMKREIGPDDEVAFMPPVTGG